MARVADHKERRETVYRIGARLISEFGLEAVTARRLAQESGFSTHIFTHYFASKRDMLLQIWRWSTERYVERLNAARQEGFDIYRSIETLLPLTEERRIEWAAGIAFFSRSTNDPEFAAEQERSAGMLRDILRDLVRSALPSLALASEDIDIAAERLQAMVVGIAVNGTAAPAHWPPERQVVIAHSEIDSTLALLSGGTPVKSNSKLPRSEYSSGSLQKKSSGGK